MKSYAFVDEIEKDILINHPISLINGKRNPTSNPPILFSRCMPIEFLDHIDKLLSILNLNIAQQMTEEVDDREETGIHDLLLVLLLSWGLDPIHLSVLP